MPVRKHPIAAANPNDPIGNFQLDRALIGRLRTTYASVRAHDVRFAELFYSKLFATAPALRAMFHTDVATQSAKLTAALDAVVCNLESPDENAAMLAAMGRRHVTYGAKPEHYDLVGRLIVESMQEVLGPEVDRRGLEEWRTALRLISTQMINASQALAHPALHGPSRERAAESTTMRPGPSTQD